MEAEAVIQTMFFLIFLHYLGDFPMQGAYLAENKGKNDYLLFAHSFIWAGVISAGLLYFGMFAIWKVLFLIAGHFLIDRWKARKVDSGNTELLIDQFLHGIQLAAVIFV
jgi:hypothetical protein